jgi:hypothetical protein
VFIFTIQCSRAYSVSRTCSILLSCVLCASVSNFSTCTTEESLTVNTYTHRKCVNPPLYQGVYSIQYVLDSLCRRFCLTCCDSVTIVESCCLDIFTELRPPSACVQSAEASSAWISLMWLAFIQWCG